MAERLFDNNVEKVSSGGRPSMMFNEKQATAIKIELQNHSKLARNGFDTLTISNDLEMMVMQQKLQVYQAMRIKELSAELANANTKLIEQEPDVNFSKAVQIDEKTTFTMDKVAAQLHLPYGRNTLIDNLKQMKIIKLNGQPYEAYKSKGISSVLKVNEHGNYNVPVANSKGEKTIFTELCKHDLICVNSKTGKRYKTPEELKEIQEKIHNPEYLNNAIKSAAEKWVEKELM